MWCFAYIAFHVVIIVFMCPVVVHACSSLTQDSSRRGIQERNYVRNMLLEAWERVGDKGHLPSEAIAKPFGCLDPDHNQKARLSDL